MQRYEQISNPANILRTFFDKNEKFSHYFTIRKPYTLLYNIKELLFKHIREKGAEGTPFKELQQVLPGHNRGQIQVLLRELRKEGRVRCEGNTSAARWFAGEASDKSD